MQYEPDRQMAIRKPATIEEGLQKTQSKKSTIVRRETEWHGRFALFLACLTFGALNFCSPLIRMLRTKRLLRVKTC